MQDVSINSEHKVEILDYSADGAGIARLEDGRVVFVNRAVRGDVCRINVTKILSRSCHGEIAELLSLSEHRIEPDCPVFDKCGGCGFRHITYAEELYAKRKRVDDALRRIGGLDIEVEDILATNKIYGYRNKAQLPVAEQNGAALIGYYSPMSHDVIETGECLLIDEQANAALQGVGEWLRRYNVPVYNGGTGKGLIRHVYIRTARTGLTVCLVINGDKIPRERELVDILRGKCPSLQGMLLNINKKRGSVVLGVEYKTLWGRDYIEESLDGLIFRMSPASFFQVNPQGAQLLYDKAREYAALAKDELLLDLYCGTGTITLYLARDAGRAMGVDYVSSSIKNARENALRNNIGNAEFIESDVSALDTGSLKPDCVVLDPPRKGLARDVIQKVFAMAPPRIVYVSCDPATLARDIKLFHDYEVNRACAVDIFPRTTHVETVVLLSKLKSTTSIEVKIDLDEMDLTKSESKATYDEIKQYVLDKFGSKVSQLYIAQVKRKHGIIERDNYNVGDGKSKVPQVPADKEKAIEDALRHFKMI